MRVRIKLCGITRIEDARCAVDLGIDALGFIFAEKSPRRLEPARAAAIIDRVPPFVARVGVFVDSGLDRLKEVVTEAGLTQVQLHGGEPPDLCRELKRWRRSLTVCKAFLVGPGAPPVEIDRYRGSIDCVLLDTYVKGLDGGTGRRFDWRSIDRQALDLPLLLAGGLNPDNVTEAIDTVRPYAIDVNSGVESSPGIKDHRLLGRLVGEVRRAEGAAG